MEVEYRDVVGFPGYLVGNNGTVISNKHKNALFLKLSINDKGYQRVTLSKLGVAKYKYVHTLVLEAFVGPMPEGFEACHGNGKRTDNRLSNLRWDTPLGNSNDMAKHGTRVRGEKSHKSKLSECQVAEILSLLNDGACVSVVAHRFGVDVSTICCILAGRNWRHIDRSKYKDLRIKKTWERANSLSEKDVLEIILRINSGESVSDIASRFEVTGQTIRCIRSGKTWKHLDRTPVTVGV